MKRNFLIILCGLFLTTIHSQTFIQNGVTYQVSSGTTNEVTVSDYDLSSLDLTIPSDVTDNGTTYSVTSIGMNAFRHDKLNSIIIPNSVTTIGSSAFQDNLFTSITIPNSVTRIDQSAFEKNLLTSVSIPNSVTSIGRSAFKINELTSVDIPNSITNIRFATFANNKLTSVTIPNSVVSVGKEAFVENNLTTINIGDGVQTIGERAFAQNPNISNVNITALVAPVISATREFDNPENIDLFVPEGSKDIYTNNGWVGFKTVSNNNPTPVLSIQDVTALANASIYSLDSQTLRVSDFPTSNKNTLFIYDLLGKHVFTTPFSTNGGAKDINIPITESGIYIIHIQSAIGDLTKKISLFK